MEGKKAFEVKKTRGIPRPTRIGIRDVATSLWLSSTLFVPLHTAFPSQCTTQLTPFPSSFPFRCSCSLSSSLGDPAVHQPPLLYTNILPRVPDSLSPSIHLPPFSNLQYSHWQLVCAPLLEQSFAASCWWDERAKPGAKSRVRKTPRFFFVVIMKKTYIAIIIIRMIIMILNIIRSLFPPHTFYENRFIPCLLDIVKSEGKKLV